MLDKKGKAAARKLCSSFFTENLSYNKYRKTLFIENFSGKENFRSH